MQHSGHAERHDIDIEEAIARLTREHGMNRGDIEQVLGLVEASLDVLPTINAETYSVIGGSLLLPLAAYGEKPHHLHFAEASVQLMGNLGFVFQRLMDLVLQAHRISPEAGRIMSHGIVARLHPATAALIT